MKIVTDEFKKSLVKNSDKGVDTTIPSTDDKLEGSTSAEPKKDDTPSKMGKYLARNMIEAYRSGELGEPGTKSAKANLASYILSEIGSRMANASSVARGGGLVAESQWSKHRQANEENNANIRAYESQYSAAQGELANSMGKDKWDALTADQREAKTLELLQRKGVVTPQSYSGLATTKANAAELGEQREKLEIAALDQNQKAIATSNLEALVQRRKELNELIAKLRSDQGWDTYAQAMEAYVGTARGLSSTGIADNVQDSLTKGHQIGVSANVGAGNVASKFVKADISADANWNKQATTSEGKQTTRQSDSLAYGRFTSGEKFAQATAEEKKAANAELIENLKNEIRIIDQVIDAWGKPLGIDTSKPAQTEEGEKTNG